MKTVCKKAMILLAVFAVTLLLLWGLLALSACIPNEGLRANMEQSALSYKDADAFSFDGGQKLNAVSDNYADTILLNISWHMGNGNPAAASLDTKYYDGGEMGENYGLYASVTGNAAPDTDYTRYFHGSAMFVRFFHLFADVHVMKWCGFIAAALLAALTCVLLVRKKQPWLAFALLLSLAAVQFWNIRLSLEYQPAFIVCFLLCPLYLLFEEKHDGWLTVLSVIGGCMVAFFDFLTTETVVLLLPLTLVVAVRARENRLGERKENFLWLLKNGAAFGAAYAGTFLTKWTVATIVTGENKFASALSSVGERIGGTLADEGITNPLLRIPAAVAANLSTVFGGEARVEPVRVIVGLFIVIAVLGSIVFLFRRKGVNKTALLLLTALGGVVILRFMALSNHSYLHEFFTYRALIVPIFALLCGVLLCILPQKEEVQKR